MAAAPTSAGQKALRTAIQERTFAPVYYFHGVEDYLKEEFLRQLIDAAIDPATRDFNLESLRAGELDAERLGSVLATPPMMAERRVVIVRDVGALRKEARRALDQYLARPASDSTVILVAAAGGKEDRGLAEHAVAVEFDRLSGNRIPKWITYYASHDLGCEITAEAATLLQDAVGTELSQLQTELDKLASFAAGGERRVIDEDAVSAIVGVQRGETLGDLLDAVAIRDAARALELLPHVLQQPKTSAVTMVMALATQMLGIAFGRALLDNGTPPGRVERELYDLLKEAGSPYTGRSWGDAVRCWTRGLNHWTVAEVDDALAALLGCDAALKETRVSSDEQFMQSLILALCTRSRAGARRAA